MLRPDEADPIRTPNRTSETESHERTNERTNGETTSDARKSHVLNRVRAYAETEPIAADALAGDKTTRPSEAAAPTAEYLRAREESTKS